VLFFRNLLLLAIICSAGVTASCQPTAQAINDSQSSLVSSKAELIIRLNDFQSIFENEDISEVLDFTPPKAFEALIKAKRSTDQTMRADVNQGWATALETITVEKVSFDTDNIQIQTSPIGRSFALVPLNMTFGVKADQNTVVKASSTTIALVDSGIWYIVRLEEPSIVEIFKKSYPDLAKISFPPATMDAIPRKAIP